MRPVIGLAWTAATVMFAAADPWLVRVEPILSGAEKARYVSLNGSEREAFQQALWSTRKITAAEYMRRVEHIDAVFGSGKAGSGANTDRGRVYLALGAPGRVVRVASSRNFFPAEIWYYPEAAAIDIHTELQLLFYQRNGQGEYRLYSPTVNTIRDLLAPQPSLRGMFPVNDIVTESDVRTRLTLSPAEDEMIDAATAVVRGVKGGGNEAILALAASPARALAVGERPLVRSRMVTDHPPMVAFVSPREPGQSNVDLQFTVKVQRLVGLQIRYGNVTLGQNETRLPFESETTVNYRQRYALLGGDYTVVLTVDDHVYGYPLRVRTEERMGDVMVGQATPAERPRAPFTFGETSIEPTASGTTAMVQRAEPAEITWRLRKGFDLLWSTRTSSGRVDLTGARVAPGTYELEAAALGETRSATVRLGGSTENNIPVISYNANLSPSETARFVGRQWISRGKTAEARHWLEAALRENPDDTVRIELCRLDATSGRLDTARQTLEQILSRNPRQVEALVALAYVEAQLQDYAVAERLYERALEVQRSPEVEKALANLRALASAGRGSGH